MVQKYQSPIRVYKYPFELVMKAYEMRFPVSDMIPIVIETEILEESESEDTSVQMIDRRAKLSIEAPYLLKKIMGVEYLLFRQKNTLNRRKRTLTIDAWNESFSNRLVINEFCVYSVHPENSNWTCFEQSADLDIKSFFGFEGTAEKLAIKEYSKSIGKSKDIMEHHISVLAEQGITFVEIWKGDSEELVEEEPRTHDSCLYRRKSSVRLCGDSNDHNASSNEKDCRLEQDYIQSYLGELTPIQESQLVQLKSWISDLLKGKVPSDPILLRFLRARDFNVEKAREMLSESLFWRKKHEVDRILSEYELPEVVKKYFPGGWHNYDKQGRPLFILRLGQVDVKGIIKSVGQEGLIKLTLHVCEEGLRRTEKASHELNKPISTWCLLLDLEGLNMRHLWRPGMKALLNLIEICEANYPETLGRVLIIRAPRVFPIMWTLVSPLIDENSRGKFLFYGGKDYQNPGGLIDYIDLEHIPNWLGGANTSDTIAEGGLVPKSYYMSTEEFEKDQSPGPHFLEESYYHSASMSRGQVHEGLIQISAKGSVITWDFDVMRQDILFTVFRLKVRKTHSLSPSHNQICTDPQDHKTVFEKGWKEGTDYFRVENPIVCHDGESIQGSHVTSYIGTYVLQWKFFDKVVPNVIDSITSHKAKVMYYYETLSSEDYKGSMTSLQSCQSGFSTISKNSHQSTSGVSSAVSSTL